MWSFRLLQRRSLQRRPLQRRPLQQRQLPRKQLLESCQGLRPPSETNVQVAPAGFENIATGQACVSTDPVVCNKFCSRSLTLGISVVGCSFHFGISMPENTATWHGGGQAPAKAVAWEPHFLTWLSCVRPSDVEWGVAGVQLTNSLRGLLSHRLLARQLRLQARGKIAGSKGWMLLQRGRTAAKTVMTV